MSEVTDLIASKVKELRTFGERLLPNGTQLISPAPEIAPKAWHFVLFAPLKPHVIEEMEKELDATFPEDFRNFLKVWNGVKLFGYEINVWGKRKNFAREGDEAWQPFNLSSHNRRSERPGGSPESIVYIGSAEHGEKWIFIDLSENGKIGSTPRWQYEPDQYWSNFNEWLRSEFVRLWTEHYERES